MTDARYEVPVGGKSAALLGPELNDLERRFPGLGVTLFVFDFGGPGKGLSYISNANREDMVRTVMEWVRKQQERSN